MSTWSRIRLAVVAALGAAGLAAAVAFAVADPGPGGVAGDLAWVGLGIVPLYAVGLWLVSRRPEHPQARRLLLLASSGAVAAGMEGAIQKAYGSSGPDGWFWLVNLMYQMTSTVTVIAAVALFASYPDGIVERSWQRRLLVLNWWQLALPPLLLLSSPTVVIHYYLLNPAPVVPSPVAGPWLAWLGGSLTFIVSTYILAIIGPALLLVRFVQAGPEQRQRMRLLAYTMAAAGMGLVLSGALYALGASTVIQHLVDGVFIAVMLMVAVSIVVGVLRYRLFEIDVVVRRSVVYGVLALGIAAVYAGLAAAPGLALGHQVPVELAVVLTIAAAVAFQPLRRRLERVADRWVFGQRVNRYELLTGFGASLEQTVGLGELLPRLAQTVRQGLGASWVRVSVPGASAVAGEPAGEAALTVPLGRNGEASGQIECGPRDGDYQPDDRELLATLAGQAATAIANLALTARLAEQVAELDRSRGRIVTAQDAERRRIERNIHDGAQQQVVALLTKLRLARNQLARGGGTTDDMLDELQADARDLLADLRELAQGIHPTLLSDQGLVAAVKARADRLPLDVAVRAEPALHGRRLDADVEGAAYFVVCEALTNVIKHATAGHAEVSLAAPNGHLEIAVRDDGVGLGTRGTESGTGLVNLRDRVEALGGRLQVGPGDLGGTTVRAELPVGARGG